MNVIEFLRSKIRSRADRCGTYGTCVPDVSVLNWIDEAERLAEELDTGNYVADRETHPQSVTFANGRRVRIVIEDGQPSLDVDWEYTPTAESDAAVDLIEPEFIERLTNPDARDLYGTR